MKGKVMNNLSKVIAKVYNEQVRWEALENHGKFSAEHYEELIKKHYEEVKDEISFEEFEKAVWADFDAMMY